jgi:hypothetical protein
MFSMYQDYLAQAPTFVLPSTFGEAQQLGRKILWLGLNSITVTNATN